MKRLHVENIGPLSIKNFFRRSAYPHANKKNADSTMYILKNLDCHHNLDY